MKPTPLSALELYELLCAAYPDKFSDDDEGWDAVMDFADGIEGVDEIADLLGRIVTLTNPIFSGLTGKAYHALGGVAVKDGQVHMVAAVKRPVESE